MIPYVKPVRLRTCLAATLVYMTGVVAFQVWRYRVQTVLPEANATVVAGRELIQGSLLLALALPLIVLAWQARQNPTASEGELNDKVLRNQARILKLEKALHDAEHDLQRFENAAASREVRVLQLKVEVNDLLEELKREKRYTTADTE